MNLRVLICFVGAALGCARFSRHGSQRLQVSKTKQIPPQIWTRVTISKDFYQRDPPSPTLSCQSGAEFALSAGFAAGTLAAYGERRHARLAHPLSGSLAREAPRQEGQRRTEEAVSGSSETALRSNYGAGHRWSR